MSDYLLDTNILIALINKTEARLPLRIQTLLKSQNCQPTISAVSTWEISIKTASGKLQINEDVAELGAFIAQLGCPLLPIAISHALEVAYPEPATKDPFDRLLLAVCVCEGLKLVTTDAALQGHRLVY